MPSNLSEVLIIVLTVVVVGVVTAFSYLLMFKIARSVYQTVVVGFVRGCAYLVLDLRERRRERLDGFYPVWYQRPRIQIGLQGIGLSLAMLLQLGALVYGVAHISWLWMIDLLMEGSYFIGACVFLFLDLRAFQREREEGLPATFYRRPRTLKYLEQIAFPLAILLILGSIGYGEGPNFSNSPWLLIFGILVPILFFLLGIVLYLYANTFLQGSRCSFSSFWKR